MIGSDRATGGELWRIVFDECSTKVRPVSLLMISRLYKVCGPPHRVTVGESKFEALTKEKKPMVSAALTGEE